MDINMTDEKVKEVVHQAISKLRNHVIVFIAGAVILATIVFSILFIRQGASSDVKELKKENKQLAGKIADLDKKIRQDSINFAFLRSDVETMIRERNEMLSQIEASKRSINQLTQQYEKISDYRNVAGDSLFRIFTRRFDY